ncbi:hypothetical protein [Ferrimonas balearica]|uniref:hypothetical protein n=1 Tax=Ferrimonas balearica TaxID=44012 RepID=UPI001494082F|nr:hypothetical protein [Ferrimonas balearica]
MSYNYSKLWVKAVELSGLRRYDEAKSVLIEMETSGGKADLEYCLLRGFIEYMHCNRDGAISSLKAAIEKAKKSKRLNSQEKGYLIAYAEGMLREYGVIHCQADYRTINLKKVPSHFKRKYPLTDHPGWND